MDRPDSPHRRRVLKAGVSAGAALGTSPAFAQPAAWSAGDLVHLVPAVSDERMQIKCSFRRPLAQTPRLAIDGRRVEGRRSDSEGAFWRFEVEGLAPDTAYRLRIVDRGGRPLCDPWPLRTFPASDAKPRTFRLLTYTCAGGYPGPIVPGGQDLFRPLPIRHALLDRALSFRPDAVIANGDHIYWDQRTWLESTDVAFREAVKAFFARFGSFDPAQPALGGTNEATIKRLASAQIAELYGVRFRSTPTFFVGDDHDYFENDEATARYVTFPPEDFEIELKRATQHLFYPEFLPHRSRPATLPGASAADRWAGLSESFGTLRYGDLVEALIYDCGRHLSLKGPFAGLVPPQAEAWLLARTMAEDTRHLLHVPSHPMGWSAGKWREWYPDVVMTEDGAGSGVREMNLSTATAAGNRPASRAHLSTATPKYLWQSGWGEQHQRLVAALSGQKTRAAVTISGDLHAVGWARLRRSGGLNLEANPLHTLLSGPVGTTGVGWPSTVRGIAPKPATQMDMDEVAPPLERNGFTLMDFDRDRIIVRQFAWREPQPAEAIGTLEPLNVFDIKRPAA